MSAIESYSFVRPPNGKSPAIQVLTADETKDCVARAGTYDLFVAILRAEPHPTTTYLQIDPFNGDGVRLRGYMPLLSPQAYEYRRKARARLNLPK